MCELKANCLHRMCKLALTRKTPLMQGLSAFTRTVPRYSLLDLAYYSLQLICVSAQRLPHTLHLVFVWKFPPIYFKRYHISYSDQLIFPTIQQTARTSFVDGTIVGLAEKSAYNRVSQFTTDILEEFYSDDDVQKLIVRPKRDATRTYDRQNGF